MSKGEICYLQIRPNTVREVISSCSVGIFNMAALKLMHSCGGYKCHKIYPPPLQLNCKCVYLLLWPSGENAMTINPILVKMFLQTNQSHNPECLGEKTFSSLCIDILLPGTVISSLWFAGSTGFTTYGPYLSQFTDRIRRVCLGPQWWVYWRKPTVTPVWVYHKNQIGSPVL